MRNKNDLKNRTQYNKCYYDYYCLHTHTPINHITYITLAMCYLPSHQEKNLSIFGLLSTLLSTDYHINDRVLRFQEHLGVWGQVGGRSKCIPFFRVQFLSDGIHEILLFLQNQEEVN